MVLLCNNISHWLGTNLDQPCIYILVPSHKNKFNSLAPGISECDSKNVIFNLVLLIGIFRSSHDNALRWMTQDLTHDKSTLVQVMAWCRQATSHYLSQCWLSSLSPYVVARPQWVKKHNFQSSVRFLVTINSTKAKFDHFMFLHSHMIHNQIRGRDCVNTTEYLDPDSFPYKDVISLVGEILCWWDCGKFVGIVIMKWRPFFCFSCQKP